MTDYSIQLNKLFQSFKIHAHVSHFYEGLRTTRYFVNIELGEKISKIKSLEEEIALAIKCYSRPKFLLKPETGHLVIEATTNSSSISIELEQILLNHKSNSKLPLILGKNMDGETYELDLGSAPHLLIAGTTGSGKSVVTNTIIKSLQNYLSESELRFAFIDPKQVELSKYSNSNYSLCHTTSGEQVLVLLNTLVSIMEARYKIMSQRGYSCFSQLFNEAKKLNLQNTFYIVVVIDELADLLMQDQQGKIFNLLGRLLQKSRASGIHIVANTQRPSRDVIKGILRANMPAQIALKTTSAIDSRIIIGQDGAESLFGKGDMLVNYNGQVARVQAAI